MRTRKARLPDAVRIYELVAEYARETLLLSRPLAEICENIRDFTVAESSGRVVGCGALHFYGTELAEVRSVAVERARQKRGVGQRLVAALLKEAQAHSVARVFLFTRIPDYFVRCGFLDVEPGSLPEKIWKDCLKCPRFNCCDETAMVFAGAPAFAKASADRPALARPSTGRSVEAPAPPVLRTLPG